MLVLFEFSQTQARVKEGRKKMRYTTTTRIAQCLYSNLRDLGLGSTVQVQFCQEWCIPSRLQNLTEWGKNPT